MFFVLSKLFWLLAAPSHLLFLLVLATGLCLLLRWLRAARLFGIAAALLLILGGMSPLPLWAVRAVESQYPRPAWPTHVDGVLILGAGFDTALLKQRHAPQANAGLLRVVEAYAAARHYPNAHIVFSGGSGFLHGQPFSEAETARYLLDEIGLEPKRLTLEPRSRNSHENFLFSQQLVKPKRGEVWLLATSAIHMPRAMAIAKKLDWPMQAWPTDFMTAPDSRNDPFEFVGNLGLADYAMHEWIGMLAYRITGKAA
jgi:uncharacterized SAM-binding protein YcdF (DUF218 family)